MRYLIGDTETTGLGGPPAVMACEIAIIEIDADMNILGEWETLVNPGIPIEPKAMSLHGITNEDVCRPEVPKIAEAFAEIAGPDGFGEVALICHNIKFDRRFLSPHLNVVAELCTLELARRVMPNAPNHQLGTLRRHCDLKVQAEHQAMGDIMIVLDLLRYLVPRTNRTLTQLIGAAAKPVMLFTMPWGQYKGMKISDIDVDYRNWCLQQDISPDLRFTLETLQKAFI